MKPALYTLSYLEQGKTLEFPLSQLEYDILLMKSKGLRNCYTCKHLEYVQGEAWEPSGYCCNSPKRGYKNQAAEWKHLKQLEKDSYLRKGKKCHEPT